MILVHYLELGYYKDADSDLIETETVRLREFQNLGDWNDFAEHHPFPLRVIAIYDYVNKIE